MRRLLAIFALAAATATAQDAAPLLMVMEADVVGWTPSNASPRLWLDATHTNGMTFSGTEILTWTNKGTQAAQATPQTTTRRADLLTDPVSGKTGAYFDGSVDYYRWSLASVVRAAPALTIAVVARHEAIGATRVYFYERTLPGLTRARLMLNANSGWALDGRWNDTDLRSLVTDNSAASTNIVAVVATMNPTSDALAIYRNGTSIKTGSGADAVADADSSAAPFIGSEGSIGFFNGYLFEMIIFPSALNSTDLNRLNTYLKNKWGTP